MSTATAPASFAASVNAKAAELSQHVCRMCTAAGSGHPSTGTSLAHIVTTLLYKVMKFDLANPTHPGNDRLVLSEGHAVPIVYAALADLGCAVYEKINSQGKLRPLAVADLAGLRDQDSVLDGHPNPFEGVPFFDAATGSLGQGLSVAAGLALGARQDGQKDKKVYCIIGDGESREGQIWEAADFIIDHKLTNVCAIFNCNKQGQASGVSHQQSSAVTAAKMVAAGFDVRVVNGHDADDLLSALLDVGQSDRPVCIVANTKKGWGVVSLQDQGHHGKPLTDAELSAAVAELEPVRLSATPLADRPAVPASGARVSTNHAVLPPPVWETVLADFPKDLKKAQTGKVAGRLAWSWAIRHLGKLNPAVVCVDGDVSNSTHADAFKAAFPDRFYECKIAEQNMVSVAAGLSAGGKVPFASTFAKFLARAYDQLEMAAITRANLKVVGTHAGVTLASDGPSQMSLQDVAYFRSLASSSRDGDPSHPGCVVFLPADAVTAWHAVGLLGNHVGLGYLRVLRADTPILYKPDTQFRVGGSHVLREGDAITLVAHTYMVHECLKAADLLAADGVKVTVVDAYSLPLDGAPILAAAAKTQKKILVVEDNFGGGVHGAVAEAAAEAGSGVKVSAQLVTRMPKSGRTPDDVLNYLGLSAKHIAQRVKALV